MCLMAQWGAWKNQLIEAAIIIRIGTVVMQGTPVTLVLMSQGTGWHHAEVSTRIGQVKAESA